MKNRLVGALAIATFLTITAFPALAQTVRRPSVAPPPNTGLQLSNPARAFPQRVFVPGFGLQPVIPEQFPVFGQGFDAHHFSVLNRQRGFFGGGFFGGGFMGNNFFGGGFFPLSAIGSTTTVIVVPQPVPVVVQEVRAEPAEVVVPVGLPPNWGEVQVARPSYPVQQAPISQLTLIVLKDQTIFAVTDYWLEEGRVFYVTSTGAQKSVALRDLDWEMSTRLNAERGVEFVLGSKR